MKKAVKWMSTSSLLQSLVPRACKQGSKFQKSPRKKPSPLLMHGITFELYLPLNIGCDFDDQFLLQGLLLFEPTLLRKTFL